MSIDREAKLVIGCPVSESSIFGAIEDLAEWAEEEGMEVCFPWFDADSPDWIIGFEVEEFDVKKMGFEWTQGLKGKAEKFEKLSGVYGQLVCTLHVY